MNLHSAELLQNSLQSAAENLYRNRALEASMQEEAQRNAIEQSFRNAMMQHYANIEQRQADNAGLQEKRLENEDTIAAQRQAGILQQQQLQSRVAQKQNFLRTAMQLNATGQLAPDGLKRVNDWLSTDPDMSKTGIQLSTPANPSTDPGHAQTALSNALSLREIYQYKYDKEQDPYIRGQYSKVLQDIDASLGGKRSRNVPQVSKPAVSPISKSASGPNADDGTSNPTSPFSAAPQNAAAPSSPTNPTIQQSTNPVPSPAPVQTGQQSSNPAIFPPTNPTIQQSNNPVSADPRDIQWLTNNPTPLNIRNFEQVYGQDSSAPFLKPKIPTPQ